MRRDPTTPSGDPHGAERSRATPTGRQRATAYLQVLLAGSLWATSGPFSIALHRLGIPPTSVALLRPAAGTLFLGALFLALGGARSRTRRPAILRMTLGGGLIVGTFQLAFQMSTESVGVPATVALLYLAPGLVLVLSVPLFGERLTTAKGLLALLSVAGVWLTVLGSRGVDVELSPTGVVWGCLCGAGYAAYTLFGKHYAGRHGPLAPLFWSTLGGTGFLALAWAVEGRSVVLPADALTWAVLLLFGLLTIAASALLLFHALRTLEAGRASIGTTIEPLMATLLAIALLDQVLTVRGWVGLALLLIGVSGAYALPSGKSRPTVGRMG